MTYFDIQVGYICAAKMIKTHTTSFLLIKRYT